MMKKNLFILAAAALAFAACSNDEVVESVATSDSNAISFRPLISNVTRALDITNSGDNIITGFKVTATETATTNVYFTNVDFTGTGTFTSATKYYWPSGYNLDFFAYAPIDGTYVGNGQNNEQIIPWDPTANANAGAYSSAAYKIFKVVPATAAASQVDFVYAKTNDWGKVSTTPAEHIVDGSTVEGVAINFRHTESKVRIKLYNSNSNISVIVRDASICNVKGYGVFTLSATDTDGRNEGAGTTLDISQWEAGGTANISYLQTDQSNSKYNVAVGSAAQVGTDWILIPQTLNYETTYDDTDNTFTGACIKVNLKIKNNAGSTSYIVGADDDNNDSDDNEGYITALWPLKSAPTAWEPGKLYTYSVDLAGGGYYEENQTGDEALDPILAGAEIKFVTVTVDDWTEVNGNVYTGATPSTPVVP